MMRIAPLDAVALFGSTVRGDSDKFSDRDLLFVSQTLIDRERNPFASAGYSVSAFTWEQLEKMMSEGSLFLQHLKQEARIIHDPSKRLASTLTRFEPARNQHSKIIENQGLFNLTKGVPNDPASLGWAFDVLAVALRNHCVLRNALRARYEFSYPTLVTDLKAELCLSASEYRLLLDLRALKREYRQTGVARTSSWLQLLRTQSVLEKVLSIEFVDAELSREEFIRERLAISLKSNHWYHVLRSYEGAFRAIPHSSSGVIGRDAVIERVFRNAAPYGLSELGSLLGIRNYVAKFTELHQTQCSFDVV